MGNAIGAREGRLLTAGLLFCLSELVFAVVDEPRVAVAALQPCSLFLSAWFIPLSTELGKGTSVLRVMLAPYHLIGWTEGWGLFLRGGSPPFAAVINQLTAGVSVGGCHESL